MNNKISHHYTKYLNVVIFSFVVYAFIRALMLFNALENLDVTYTRVIIWTAVVGFYLFSFMSLKTAKLGSFYTLIILGLCLPGVTFFGSIETMLKHHALLGLQEYTIIFGQFIPILATLFFLANGAKKAYKVDEENL